MASVLPAFLTFGECINIIYMKFDFCRMSKFVLVNKINLQLEPFFLRGESIINPYPLCSNPFCKLVLGCLGTPFDRVFVARSGNFQ